MNKEQLLKEEKNLKFVAGVYIGLVAGMLFLGSYYFYKNGSGNERM